MNFFIALVFVVFSFSLFAQAPQPQTQSEIEQLRQQVKELKEISAENSEIIKRQLSDHYYDQNSRGYLEIKVGGSRIDPDDINDMNDDIFNDLDGASWERFDYAAILDLEFGKTILSNNENKHEFGIGYQYLRSKKLEASYPPSGGGSTIRVHETIQAHTLFARYAFLFKAGSGGNTYWGPGITLGFSPVSELTLELEQGNEGEKLKAEGTSFLFEAFWKAKHEFTRYFYVVATAGYRMQEAEDLRLNAAELVSVKTRTDLDMSGVFGTVGIAASF